MKKIIIAGLSGFILCIIMEIVIIAIFLYNTSPNPDGSGFRYSSSVAIPKYNSTDPDIITYDGEIDTLHYDRKIYVVQLEQLLESVAKQDTAIVYCWDPYCTGPTCCSPRAFEECCIDKNWHPFVYTSFIDKEMLPSQKVLGIPMLFIDPNPFGSNILSTYEERIIKSMTGSKDMESRFMRFEKGQFIEFIDHM